MAEPAEPTSVISKGHKYARLERVRAKVPSYLRTDLPKQVGFNRVVRAVILEYFATTLFVFYACGSVVASQVYGNDTVSSAEASGTPAPTLFPPTLGPSGAPAASSSSSSSVEGVAVSTVAQNLFAAIVQGFAIAMLVYAISHTSGGHINPAVTLALMISGNIGIIRGIFYIIAQLLGGITGAALLSAFLPAAVEGALGTTTLGKNLSQFQGYLFEFFITFGLLFTIFGTALNKEAAASGTSSLAPLPIGFSIIVGVGIAYQFTGGSMNPARTFGPALISNTWTDHYIYWFGPITAALLVGFLERFFALFSQGQHAVFRAVAMRKRKEIRQATGNPGGAPPPRRSSVVNAVSVVLEPGAEPVNMVPMVNPDHPERPFMVPVATNEQLDQLMDVDPPEPQSILRTPPMPGGSSLRKKSLMESQGTRRRSTAAVQFAEEPYRSPKNRKGSGMGGSSSGFSFKRKLSLIPPVPLSDFSYLSDESLEDYPQYGVNSAPVELNSMPPRSSSAPPASEPTGPDAHIPVVVMPSAPSPRNSPALRSSRSGLSSSSSSPRPVPPRISEDEEEYKDR